MVFGGMVGEMCGCVADGMGIKTNGIIRIECNSGKSPFSPPFWPAQIVEPEMTARDLHHLLTSTSTPAGSFMSTVTKVGVVGIIELESSVSISALKPDMVSQQVGLCFRIGQL